MTPDEAKQLKPGDKLVMVSTRWTNIPYGPDLGDIGSFIGLLNYSGGTYIQLRWEDDSQVKWYLPKRLEYLMSSVDGISLGDTVKVKDPGRGYSHYGKWAKKYALSGFVSGATAPTGMELKVIRIAGHTSTSDILLGLEDPTTHQQWIINAQGVQVIAGHATAEPASPNDLHKGMIQRYDGTWSWGFL
jgi:hypothetical protein